MWASRLAISLVISTVVTSSVVAGEPAATILTNGKIVSMDAGDRISSALAIDANGRIIALGADEEIRTHAATGTRTIDLGGRTVIPGLTDAHIHAIRAALTYSVEVSWIGVPTLAAALDRVRVAAEKAAPDAWIIVAGGWTDSQFAERRKPTQAELMAVAGDRPVYIQHLYDWVLLTPAAMAAMEIADDADLPKFGRLLRGVDGRLTGEIAGNGVTFLTLFNKLPQPTMAQEVEGTKAFFRELSRLAVTSVLDPAGVSVGPASYQPLFKLWRDKALTVRVAYYVSSQRPGTSSRTTRLCSSSCRAASATTCSASPASARS